MTKPTKKFYAVWIGRKPGVYKEWDDCQKQVNGFEGARFKSYVSLVQAQKAFEDGSPPSTSKDTKILRSKSFGSSGSPVAKSISVDAACSGNPGIMEYRGVDTGTGALIFKQGPFPNGTNNIGEFLAIVHALAFMAQRQLKMPVYTDSTTAIAWVRSRKAKTKLKPDERNAILFDLILRAENWLKQNTGPFDIRKWPTKKWGEIPADFGRK